MLAALSPDDASMRFDESFADGQAEARAAGMLPTTMLRAIETLEHIWQFVGSDARPVVCDRDDNGIVPLPGIDTHRALAVDQRVGQQVVQHHLNARAVDIDKRQ